MWRILNMAYNNNGGPSLLLILIYGWKAFFLGFILLAVIICFPFRLLLFRNMYPPVRYWLLPNEKMYKKQAEWYEKHSKTP